MPPIFDLGGIKKTGEKTEIITEILIKNNSEVITLIVTRIPWIFLMLMELIPILTFHPGVFNFIGG